MTIGVDIRFRLHRDCVTSNLSDSEYCIYDANTGPFLITLHVILLLIFVGCKSREYYILLKIYSFVPILFNKNTVNTSNMYV